jgi:putative membrane protein
MIALPEHFASAWSFPFWPCTSIAATSMVYLRGWRRVHRNRPAQMPVSHAIYFSLGLIALWVAICSPIDTLDDVLLSAHMTQHFILMSVAPPLIVLGSPSVPLLVGLPRPLLRAAAHVSGASWFRELSRVILHPVFAWFAMNVAYVVWHVPAMFEVALHSENWHTFEHLCFFLTSVAFWWIVIQPWPSRAHWSRWFVVLYLVSADLVNTMVSAFLTFSGRVLYPTYASAQRVSNLSPLTDQVAAGAGMWFFGSLVFLLAAALVAHSLLSPHTPSPVRAGERLSPELVLEINCRIGE